MKKYIDLMFDSMIKHDSSLLPMTPRYKATENGKPAALCHMTCWRTITAVDVIGQIAVDKVRNTVMTVASVMEGDKPSTFVGRLKIEGDKVSEIELFLIRSRCEAGFWFEPEGFHKQPHGWTDPIPESGKASRETLEGLAAAVFDDSISTDPYPAADDCYLMELGGVVMESSDYTESLASDMDIDNQVNDSSAKTTTREPINFGLMPGRPSDTKNRVLVVDEEQGIVAAFGVVPGIDFPYIVSDETSSAFVPEQMAEMHMKTLDESKYEGKNVMVEMKATSLTISMHRFYNGKMYGFHQFTNIVPYGSIDVWAE